MLYCLIGPILLPFYIYYYIKCIIDFVLSIFKSKSVCPYCGYNDLYYSNIFGFYTCYYCKYQIKTSNYIKLN